MTLDDYLNPSYTSVSIGGGGGPLLGSIEIVGKHTGTSGVISPKSLIPKSLNPKYDIGFYGTVNGGIVLWRSDKKKERNILNKVYIPP